jgi:xanthine dehydrogenase molybdopterin-binding subunit B
VSPAGGAGGAVQAARYAGSRVQRVEDARLLTGAGTFVDDIARPGMLHACFVRSPHARARIEAIDCAEALALPGVEAVFTAADLNGDVREAWYTGTGALVPDTPRPPLAADEVRFAGDIVALVVADSRYIAEDAAELVSVDYEPLPAVASYAAADLRRHWFTRPIRGTWPARWAARPRRRSRTRSRAPRTSCRRRSGSRRTPPCRWRPVAWSWSGRRAS